MTRLFLLIFLSVVYLYACSSHNGITTPALTRSPELPAFTLEKIKQNTVDINHLLNLGDVFIFRLNQKQQNIILAITKQKLEKFELTLQIQERQNFTVKTQHKTCSRKEITALFSQTNYSLHLKNTSLTTIKPITQMFTPNGEGHLNISLEISALGNHPLELLSRSRIMSLNPLQLWDANPHNSDEEQLYIYDLFRPEFSNWYNVDTQKLKAQNILRMLELGEIPEIITFQEVESAGNHSEVFKEGTPLRMGLDKLGYKYFALGLQEKNNPVALTTAVVSRFPIVQNAFIPFNIDLPEFKTVSQKDRNFIKFTTRDIQIVDIKIFDSLLKIYVNHWRSQGCNSKDSCAMSEQVRIITAKLVHDTATAELKKNPQLDFLIIGDLNTSLDNNPLLYLGSTQRADLVQSGTLRENLYNLWYELPPNKRWEASYQGVYTNLSHALIPYTLYDTHGIQYAHQSYNVLGHHLPQQDFLLNGDGNPYRWQEEKIEASKLPAEIALPLENILKARNCHQSTHKKKKNRRCYATYTRFSGHGFSDHLPIYLEINYLGSNLPSLQTTFPPGAFINQETDQPLNVIVKTCQKDDASLKNYPEAKDLNLYDSTYLGKCIKVNSQKNPLPLLVTGIYDSNYIQLGHQRLALSWSRAFDSREVINGQPVGNIESKDFDNPVTSHRMDPASHMCFTRKILQGLGGKLEFAVGRLGYSSGLATIYVNDPSDIILADLPIQKQQACKGKHYKNSFSED